MKNFERTPDVYNYYGELLLDQQKYQEAIEKFDTAVEMEKATKSHGMNVLPLINKALALFQWKQDFPEAEKLCDKALISKSESSITMFRDEAKRSQSILSAILPLQQWRNYCYNRAKSQRHSSTLSVQLNCPEPKAKSSTPCRTQRQRGRSSRCKRNILGSHPNYKAWADLVCR